LDKKFTFRAVIRDAGGGGAFVCIPFDVEAVFGKKRVPVQAWIEGVPYRGTLMRMGAPTHMLGVLKDIRRAVGKDIGDEVEVVLQQDTTPRIVDVPPDLQQALDGDPAALAAFQKLSYTHQREHVRAVLDAKQPATRRRRIEKTILMLTG
jgi:hypothetical protein